MNSSQKIKLLKWASFLIFIGRGYQYLFWDAPFRAFLWDESLLEPVVNSLLDMSWQEYASNLTFDKRVNIAITINGFLFLIAGIASLLINEKNKKWLRIPIFIGGVFLVILSLLLTKEKFYHLAMFFEHAIQFGTPFALLYYLKNESKPKLLFVLKILIAFTFTCHGIYALGKVYPMPGDFVTMTINILPITEASAIKFLFVAALLDFLVALLIFIPKTAKIALIYAGIWGLLTALARIVANFSFDFPWQTLHQNLYHVIYRIPHGLIPIIVFLILNKNGIKSASS
ncbi:MAG: hypothetical protein HRT68_00355 [Flavobacteriaceae bacterium]|nr:hypothetical protein [Flavobacteriaceae bacterium]